MLKFDVEINVKPLEGPWDDSQDPFPEYVDCRFKAGWFKTRDLLFGELKRINVDRALLYTSHKKSDRSADGWVREDRKPPHPGVVLEFDKWDLKYNRFNKLRFPCNTYELFEDNLRAIALALEALRAVDRYGVTTGAQYTGYKALPPAEPGTPGQTPEQAAEFIVNSSGLSKKFWTIEAMLEDRAAGEYVYKAAAKRLHPDKEGGDQVQFARLETSMQLVRAGWPNEVTEEPK